MVIFIARSLVWNYDFADEVTIPHIINYLIYIINIFAIFHSFWLNIESSG